MEAGGGAPAERESMSRVRRASMFLSDDRATGLICILLGALVFGLANSQASSGSALIPGSSHPVIQGTFYPRAVSVLIMVAGAVLIVVESLRLLRGAERAPWMLVRLPGDVVRRSFILLGAVVALAPVIEPLGFVIPVAALATLFGRWFGAPNWRSSFLSGVVITVVIYVLFTQVFASPLPAPTIR